MPTSSDPSSPPPVVYFRGMFRNNQILWNDRLNLAEGLYLAEFVGPRDPIEVVVIRHGIPLRVNVNRLLRGLENPQLFPNDIVEIRR